LYLSGGRQNPLAESFHLFDELTHLARGNIEMEPAERIASIGESPKILDDFGGAAA
jgi:hypothetical protein